MPPVRDVSAVAVGIMQADANGLGDLTTGELVTYVFMSTKRQDEKRFRVPRSVFEEMLAIKTESPYVFAALSEQSRTDLPP